VEGGKQGRGWRRWGSRVRGGRGRDERYGDEMGYRRGMGEDACWGGRKEGRSGERVDGDEGVGRVGGWRVVRRGDRGGGGLYLEWGGETLGGGEDGDKGGGVA